MGGLESGSAPSHIASEASFTQNGPSDGQRTGSLGDGQHCGEHALTNVTDVFYSKMVKNKTIERAECFGDQPSLGRLEWLSKRWVVTRSPKLPLGGVQPSSCTTDESRNRNEAIWREPSSAGAVRTNVY